MTPDESKLTTAQRAFLNFINREDARTLYDSLSDTLSLAMVNGANPGHTFIPTPATLDSWYFFLQIMQHIHDIAAERPDEEKETPAGFGN